MSTATRIKSMFRPKVVNYGSVPLKKLDTLMVDFPPPKAEPKPFLKSVKPDIEYIDFRSGTAAPAHEIARLLYKVADEHPEGHVSQVGRYFTPSLEAGCIVGALILARPDGDVRARRIVAAAANGASLGGILEFLPYTWSQDMDAMRALRSAQLSNDRGVGWATIADNYAKAVGYHRPALRAA